MTPRGVRNNNFGNIEDGPFAQGLPGYRGSDGRFAVFETPQHGMDAMDRLLASYGRRGLNTVDGIINRWAPPSDGNPVSEYAKSVAAKTGFVPGQAVDMSDPATRQKIAEAMAEFETGVPMTQAFADAGKKNMTPMQAAMAQSPEQVFGPASRPQVAQPPSLSAQFINNGPGVLWGADKGDFGTNATVDLPTALTRAGVMLRDDPAWASALKSIDHAKSSQYQFVQGRDGRLFRVDKKDGSVQAVEGRGSNKYDEAYDSQLAKTNVELDSKIATNAERARGDLQTIGRLTQYVNDPRVTQGKHAEAVLWMKQIGQALGIKGIEGVQDTEAMRALTNELALKMRNTADGEGMPGALSDNDLKFLKQSTVSIENTPGANLKILEMARRVAQRKLDLETWRQEYVSQKGRLDSGFRKYVSEKANAHPLFADFEQTTGSSGASGGANRPPLSSFMK